MQTLAKALRALPVQGHSWSPILNFWSTSPSSSFQAAVLQQLPIYVCQKAFTHSAIVPSVTYPKEVIRNMEIALCTKMLTSNAITTKQWKQPLQLVGILLPGQQQGMYLEYSTPKC